MIKAPITKTGDIRYFEVIKIFVLISFSIALFSSISIKNFTLLSNASLIASSIVYLIVFVNGFLISYEGAKEILRSIKSYVIRITRSYQVKLNNSITLKEVVTTFGIDQFVDRKKLCISRC